MLQRRKGCSHIWPVDGWAHHCYNPRRVCLILFLLLTLDYISGMSGVLIFYYKLMIFSCYTVDLSWLLSLEKRNAHVQCVALYTKLRRQRCMPLRCQHAFLLQEWLLLINTSCSIFCRCSRVYHSFALMGPLAVMMKTFASYFDGSWHMFEPFDVAASKPLFNSQASRTSYSICTCWCCLVPPWLQWSPVVAT